jgi:hypothetical protein
VSSLSDKGRALMPRLDEGAFARFLDEDDGRPVLIFNLMRFGTETGPNRLADVLADIRMELARFGAEVVYIGETSSTLWEDGGGPWDAVAIVRYPGRRAFADMVESAEYYEAINSLRDASLLEVVLRPVGLLN